MLTELVGTPYTDEETDYDGGGLLTRAVFSGLTRGQAYSSYEYDYVGGVFSGSKFTYTTVPSGATTGFVTVTTPRRQLKSNKKSRVTH